MREYITLYPLRQGKKITPPNGTVVLSDEVAAQLLPYDLIKPAPVQASEVGDQKSKEPHPNPSPPHRSESLRGQALEGDGGQRAALEAELVVAQDAAAAARAALDTATPQQKGSRTAALNKAVERLKQTEDALTAHLAAAQAE